MASKIGLGNSRALQSAAAKGRRGDTMLVHVSPEEWAFGADLADQDGGLSINPETGLAEHFSFKKALKGVAKAAAAAVGGYFGGPAGAAAGGLLASKALGDNWQTALTTSALSGLGAWGVQQTGVGDGYGGFSSDADLLGQQGGSATLTGSAKLGVPAIAGLVGLAGLTSGGGGKTTPMPVSTSDGNADIDWQGYKPLDRDQIGYAGPWDKYGQQDGEHMFFNPVSPPLERLADGGKVKAKKRDAEPQYLVNDPMQSRYLYNDPDYDLEGNYIRRPSDHPYVPPVKPPMLMMDANGNFVADGLGYADGGEVADGPSMWLSGDRYHERYNADRANSAFADSFATYGQTEQNDQQPERQVLRLVTEFGMPEDEARSIVYSRMSNQGSTSDVPQGYARGGIVHMRVGGSMGAGDPGQGGGHGGPSGAGGSRSGSTGGGNQATGRGNATIADKQVMDRYIADPNQHIANEREYNAAVSNLGHRFVDTMNHDNSTLDNIGNTLAGLFGVGEIDPTQQALGASIKGPDASWGVDPLHVGATILGAVTGLPFGTLYKGAKMLTGYEGPMIGFDGFDDQSPFSNDVVSPQVSNPSMLGGLGSGATPSMSKGTQSGTIPTWQTPLPGGLSALVANSAPQDGGLGAEAPAPAGPDGRVFQPYQGDWSTYGQPGGTAEHGFWDPNPVPLTMASGGPTPMNGVDGQVDHIPALLADGENVWSADDVAMAGNGNNQAGQKTIEHLKVKMRKQFGMKKPTKHPRKVDLHKLAAA